MGDFAKLSLLAENTTTIPATSLDTKDIIPPDLIAFETPTSVLSHEWRLHPKSKHTIGAPAIPPVRHTDSRQLVSPKLTPTKPFTTPDSPNSTDIFRYNYEPNQVFYLKEDYSTAQGNLRSCDRVVMSDVLKNGWVKVTSMDYDGMDSIIIPESLLSDRLSSIRPTSQTAPVHRRNKSELAQPSSPSDYGPITNRADVSPQKSDPTTPQDRKYHSWSSTTAQSPQPLSVTRDTNQRRFWRRSQ